MLAFVILGPLSSQILGTGRGGASRSRETSKTPDMPYRKRTSFFTRSEKTFYDNLLAALPHGHTVFAKVGLSDLLEVDAKGGSFQGAFNRIAQKHVDFVICDEQFCPYLCIELDGESHSRPRQQKADKTKDLALQAAGLRLQRYRTDEAWDFSCLWGAQGFREPFQPGSTHRHANTGAYSAEGAAPLPRRSFRR